MAEIECTERSVLAFKNKPQIGTVFVQCNAAACVCPSIMPLMKHKLLGVRHCLESQRDFENCAQTKDFCRIIKKCLTFYDHLFQLSPSFTPTSVIRKMYESKDKSKDEPNPGKIKSSDRGAGQRTNEGTWHIGQGMRFKLIVPSLKVDGPKELVVCNPNLNFCLSVSKKSVWLHIIQ